MGYGACLVAGNHAETLVEADATLQHHQQYIEQERELSGNRALTCPCRDDERALRSEIDQRRDEEQQQRLGEEAVPCQSRHDQHNYERRCSCREPHEQEALDRLLAMEAGLLELSDNLFAVPSARGKEC